MTGSIWSAITNLDRCIQKQSEKELILQPKCAIFLLSITVVRAADECIEKEILADVLVKHRAEVVDMFLTTFDRKMYEEAIREEGREELVLKYEELSRDHEELSRKHENLIRDYAMRLFENGVSYEVVRTIITEISAEELEMIHKEYVKNFRK